MTEELDDLSKKIEAAKKHRAESPENMVHEETGNDQDMSFGMRVGIELFAGVLVGAGIGYGLDRLFHKLPLFLVIFTLLGAGAGFWSIYKSFFNDSAKDSDKK